LLGYSNTIQTKEIFMPKDTGKSENWELLFVLFLVISVIATFVFVIYKIFYEIKTITNG